MQTEKTYCINVLMTRMDAASSDPFFQELLRVVESEIHRQGCILSKVWYRSLFSDDKRCRREDVDAVIGRMLEESDSPGDGLIIIGKCNHKTLVKLKQHFKATVYVNRDSSQGEVDEVICNGRKISRNAIEYLVELGHENIGEAGQLYTGGGKPVVRVLYLERVPIFKKSKKNIVLFPH